MTKQRLILMLFEQQKQGNIYTLIIKIVYVCGKFQNKKHVRCKLCNGALD